MNSLKFIREAFMKREKTHNKTGFTLVEILTTIAIIAILLGFLIPALNMVQKSAMTAKQKAQFHGIEIAMETFSTDIGDYPPSAWDTTRYGFYSASQRLAEAMVGQDGFGFHPDSELYASGQDSMGNDLYAPAVDLTDPANSGNLSARKGPYLELENANAVKLSNLYGSANLNSLVDTFILADMYKITKNAATGKLTGSPILYYRADRSKILHDATDYVTMNNSTYNAYDSTGTFTAKAIAYLKPLSTKTGYHPLCPLSGAGGESLFYEQTLNPNFPGDPITHIGARPYRSESFILQSAGPDSLYGTADDVFNFDQDN